ncbi:hypothetical protein AAE02nite_34120 [Adhaeribacter aerolatus]|uniref:DUF4834 domain-containing protein n=1 Tax=Adhaeribacter aerolatus TaxID=670289 RepID=A0A512B1A4_9BACT|nr:DUF4834 family protein [Adhaeribacter aerolatus]GEO05748.1 hypothetical protein AAE02nite_34120 [Adhaeribacter aerolatus]
MTKFLITIFLIYLFMRFVFPILLRWGIKAFIKKNIQNGRFTNIDPNAFRPANEPQPEGEVKVNYVPKQPQPNQAKDFPGGEYVDYEEVK